MYLYYCYTDTLADWILFCQIDTWLHRILLFSSSIIVTWIHLYTCVDCSCILVAWIIVHVIWIVVIWIFLYYCYIIYLFMLSHYWEKCVDLLHVVSTVIKLAHLYRGRPVISTVTLASGRTWAELSTAQSKVSHHTYTWWEPPLESVGPPLESPPPPGVGWRGCLWCSCYRYCYWSDSVFMLPGIHFLRTVMLASGKGVWN